MQTDKLAQLAKDIQILSRQVGSLSTPDHETADSIMRRLEAMRADVEALRREEGRALPVAA